MGNFPGGVTQPLDHIFYSCEKFFFFFFGIGVIITKVANTVIHSGVPKIEIDGLKYQDYLICINSYASVFRYCLRWRLVSVKTKCIDFVENCIAESTACFLIIISNFNKNFLISFMRTFSYFCVKS